MTKSIENNASPEAVDLARLKQENYTLAQQVKRLIKAESKQYEYQEELDAQLKEYKKLNELNKKINATLDIRKIFALTSEYIIYNLEYERVIFFEQFEYTGSYTVCAHDGYYNHLEKSAIAELVINEDDPFLLPLQEGNEYLICKADSDNKDLAEYRSKLLTNEYLIYPLCPHKRPHALLAVGNSAENSGFYRRVSEDKGELLGIDNLVGLLNSAVENHILFTTMETALEQKRQAEAKYRGIFENAIEGIFQATPDGRFISCNPATAAILGYETPEEVIENITDIEHQLYVDPKLRNVLFEKMRNRVDVKNFEVEFFSKDGSKRWMRLSTRPFFDEKGEILYFDEIFQDITERKQAEEELQKFNDELEKRVAERTEELEKIRAELELQNEELQKTYQELEVETADRILTMEKLREKDQLMIQQNRMAAMGEMLGNIAHQWRQPLNVLGLKIQQLGLSYEYGEFSKELLYANIDKAMEIICHMSQTIDDFRNFSMPDRVKSQFSIDQTIVKTCSMIEESFRENCIIVDVNIGGDLQVNGYPNEYSQVLLNILMNAKDALLERGICDPMITVASWQENGRAVVTITDNAGGIKDEILGNIFDAYFTTKNLGKGTGIGLFMSKKIIENRMGGRLTVRNVTGGAEFRIEV